MPLRISDLTAQQVVKLTLKEPWMASPASFIGKQGYLELRRPRTSRGLFRSQLFAIVNANSSSNRVLSVRVADFRNLGVPGAEMTFWNFDVRYDDLRSAQVFLPASAMPPEVVITTLNLFVRLGQAPKYSEVKYIPSETVLLV